jgi:hypothetical protein
MVDSTTASGVLLGLSQGGVRLRVGQPENLPEQFMLKLSKELNRWSQIVWRSAEEVGVEFLDFPSNNRKHGTTLRDDSLREYR